MVSMAAPNVLNDSFLLNVYAANGWVQEDSEWHFYDEDGYLEALKEGRVTITVKNPASGVKATCTVRVREE